MEVKLIFIFLPTFITNIYCANKTSETREIQNIRSTLALDVLTSKAASSSNTVVSILPLQFLLCKLASISRGRAKEEIMKSLGFTNDKMVRDFYSKFREMMILPLQSDLTYVNKIYVDYDRKIDMRFAENSSGQYGVHVDSVSFSMPKAATSFINRGIAAVTYRRVEEVLNPNDINNLTSLLLITAGHFKPSWEEHFDPNLTRMRTFRLPGNKRVEVPMMTKFAEFQFYDARDFRVVTTRLGNWGCTMTLVQPDYLTLDRVLDKMARSPDLMKDIRAQMKWKHLKLVMPRMKIKNQIDLDGFLKDVGLQKIFNSNSTDLNSILKETVNASNIFVSKVRQKIFFELDEFGIARIHREWRAPKPREPPNTLEVAFDRPFYFTINLELSPHEVYELFNGVYHSPEVQLL